MAEDSQEDVIREFDATKAIVASDTGGAMSLVQSGATTQNVVKTMAKLVFPCQGTCGLSFPLGRLMPMLKGEQKKDLCYECGTAGDDKRTGKKAFRLTAIQLRCAEAAAASIVAVL